MKFAFCVITFLLLLGCKEQPNPSLAFHKKSGRALGTSYSILYFSDQEIATAGLDSIFDVVNNSMSTYLPTSDISKINEGDTSVRVDSMFKEVFLLSKEVNKTTEGYFDPTVGKLVNAWGFGPKKIKLDMTPYVVDSLRQYIGFSKLSLNSDSTISKQNANITLDFNAIAKGYCVDRISAYFDKKNINNYLIELGGELIAKGSKVIENKPWRVGIDDPNQTDVRTLVSTLKLTNKAMATSGNYRKFRVDTITGKKYVHTVNPLTGLTESSSVLSVSVLANDCATADAYATAFMAMPLNKTKQIISSKASIEAYILYAVSKDSIGKFITPGFKKVLD